ncbi:hypothetical protein [Noviherbaspirillum galbum]|uniref:Uncharacterized protein n=1 Tax=Noviherbaspirillum galbum TaxID=2709383 RepID=A0A6B3SNF6_9BURK|nr:hypothetical protein [Noviherbaspirillum galbum]NEX62261.1 hypothetical protein [Noviherbaspirillum galbum]
MEKSESGYEPRITPLTHERAFVEGRVADEQMTPPENGGWNVESQRFDPVRNYRQLNRFDYDDKRFLFLPLWHLFLDAFTAGAEAGYVSRENWKRAFVFSNDWLALGNDLLHGNPGWLNERHRHALWISMFSGRESELSLTCYQEVGEYLIGRVDWEIPAQRLVLLQKSDRTE